MAVDWVDLESQRVDLKARIGRCCAVPGLPVSSWTGCGSELVRRPGPSVAYYHFFGDCDKTFGIEQWWVDFRLARLGLHLIVRYRGDFRPRGYASAFVLLCVLRQVLGRVDGDRRERSGTRCLAKGEDMEEKRT